MRRRRHRRRRMGSISRANLTSQNIAILDNSVFLSFVML